VNTRPVLLISTLVLLLAITSHGIVIGANYEGWTLLIGQLGFGVWVLSPFIVYWLVASRMKSTLFPAIAGVLLVALHGLLLYAYFSSGSSTSALVFVWSPIFELVLLGILYAAWRSYLVLLTVFSGARSLSEPQSLMSTVYLLVFVLGVLFLSVGGGLLYKAGSDSTQPTSLTWIAKSFLGKTEPFQQALAKNPSTPSEVLWLLADSNSSNVVRDVGIHKNAPIILLRHIAGSTNKIRYVRVWGVARNPNTPPDLLQDLYNQTPKSTGEGWNESKHYQFSVWPGVAGNSNTSEELLEKLSKSNHREVAAFLARNPKSNCDILKRALIPLRKAPMYDKVERKRLAHVVLQERVNRECKK